VPCVDAASALYVDERRFQAANLAAQNVQRALIDFDRITEILTGRPGSDWREKTAVEDLRAMIVRAEEIDVDSAAYLADLDRIAGSAEEVPGTRALAAKAAVVVRGSMATPAFALALAKARATLQDAEGATDVSEARGAREDVERMVTLRMDKAFEMGYVGSLWRGIEHLLPEGLAQSRGKMPATLEKVAKKTLWS
jgi:hypothetical protein